MKRNPVQWSGNLRINKVAPALPASFRPRKDQGDPETPGFLMRQVGEHSVFIDCQGRNPLPGLIFNILIGDDIFGHRRFG